MIFALNQMIHGRTGNHCVISARSYQYIRVQHSNSLKGKIAWNKGKICPEIGKKMSEYNKLIGRIPPSRKNKITTEKTKKKISDCHKGRIKSDEWQANITAGLKGRKMPESFSKTISDIMKEKWRQNPKINIYHIISKQNKKILLSELSHYESLGFTRGLFMKPRKNKEI
jgi:hypothetical protein